MTGPRKAASQAEEGRVVINADNVELEGELLIPQNAKGIVIFAHGSGSSRHSPRNEFVADIIRSAGVGTLLFDLLTPAEEKTDAMTRELRFDIPLLTERLVGAVNWLRSIPEGREMGIGFFGASTGGAAALVAAARLGPVISAVVSRGGRPDLAGEYLARVAAPTLLIVGGRDAAVITLNQHAFYALKKCEKELAFVPGATHLFEEPGALERVAELAAVWFGRHLKKSEPRRTYESQNREDSRQEASTRRREPA